MGVPLSATPLSNGPGTATDLVVRPPVPDELADFMQHHERIYGRRSDGRLTELWQESFDCGRSLMAWRNGRLVATAGGCLTLLRVPGGLVTAVALSHLAVDASERRRGMSVELLRRQYEEAAARGEPVAVFATSFGYQYARIGAGPIAWSMSAEVENDRAQLVPSASRHGIEITTGAPSELATDELRRLYESATEPLPGTLCFDLAWWCAYHQEGDLDGQSRFVLRASQSGAETGYAVYTVVQSWPDGVPGNVATVEQLVAKDETTRAALWERLLTMDLAARTEIANLALDDSLRWLLREPRELRVRGQRDILWARILDLPAALAARRYRGSGTVVVEVTDRFMTANSGGWQIEVMDGDMEIARTGAAADATLDIGDLATLWTGAGSYRALRAAGRITEHSRRAQLLGEMFAVDVAPWSAFVI